jgi:hypothetical protein
MIASIINSTGATVVIGTDTFTVRRDHMNYARILEELNKPTRNAATLRNLLDIPKAITTFTSGKVEVKDGKLLFNGAEVVTGLAKRILDLIREGNDGLAAPLTKFLENLMDNPSRRAVQGLYEWLEKSNLPITDDGCFIAWKIVGPEFKDLRTGTFDNSPGKVVEVGRNEVDEDPDRTCSHGLHFCSSGYLPHYGNATGNRVVMVKVNPADVVAFPRDYNTAKGRACKYTVLQEVARAEAPTMFDGASGVFDTGRKVTGMYVNARGAVTVTFSDNTESVTRVPALGDYDVKEVDGKIKLVPSGRTINIIG